MGMMRGARHVRNKGTVDGAQEQEAKERGRGRAATYDEFRVQQLVAQVRERVHPAARVLEVAQRLKAVVVVYSV